MKTKAKKISPLILMNKLIPHFLTITKGMHNGFIISLASQIKAIIRHMSLNSKIISQKTSMHEFLEEELNALRSLSLPDTRKM